MAEARFRCGLVFQDNRQWREEGPCAIKTASHGLGGGRTASEEKGRRGKKTETTGRLVDEAVDLRAKGACLHVPKTAEDRLLKFRRV